MALDTTKAVAGIDQNSKPTLTAVSSIDSTVIVPLYADPITHRLLVDSAAGGSGTVTSVSVTTANGVSGSVATPTTTPAITLTLGAITPTSVNGVTISGSGSIANSGTTSLTGFTGSGTHSGASSGTNTGDQTNISGNAATVTTNANLTGAVTSVGNATSLGSFTSAQLATALTDETGTGAAVFGTNPTIAKPVMSATNPTAQTYSPSAAGTATLDLSLSNSHFITMPAGNITIAVSNATNNQPFIIRILQDATGSRTVTWFTTIKWAGGVAPTLTTTASKADMFGFIRTGSNTYDGFIIGQNC